MLNIIFSKPYNEVREQCHLLKTGETKGIEDFLQEIENSLPVKTVLVPMPQSSGRAEYTLSLASRIALYVNALHNDKTVIVLNCLNGKIRDSVCGRKTIGLPFDDIEFGFAYMDGMKARVAKFREEGWKIILVDNVVDTGTTARHALEALGGSDQSDFGLITLGDTNAWRHFEPVATPPSK